ncbi:alkene reductase [Solimonas terrae]|uniref:Alkene reductase n=1 Tax=Solimonas terrae TaxID=1396819 RepID=A0A6M2BRE6_9GAMM|nr:alkene reductase [Solimonas terrae]NGY05212.1 alkene reductase [Solimonas terrae]
MTHSLFTPLHVGDLLLPNRIVMAPMTRTRADAAHVPGELIATHYAQRASAGLLIAEATLSAPGTSAYKTEPGIYSAAQVAGWKRVTDAVHAAGGRIALQVFHPGRASHAAMNDGIPPVSSTDRAIRGAEGEAFDTPRRLSAGEMPRLVEQFRHAFENAWLAGFDAVEIHGAHGYLLDQFLRDSVNDRGDAYGGPLDRRARLLLEVVDQAIAAFGAGRVGVRISPLVSFNDVADSDPRALVQYVADQLTRRSVAFLELRHNQHDAEEERALADIARRHFRGVLIRNGGFDRDSGDAAIADGSADAISYGKPFLANPDLAERFRRNAPLANFDFSQLYTPGPLGYIDQPAHEPAILDTPALA